MSWSWSWEVTPGPLWARGHHTVGLSKRERREKMWRQGEREVGFRGSRMSEEGCVVRM